MKQYEVTGPQAVFGHKKGEVFERELEDDQERRLIAAGHITPAAKPAAKKEA